MSIIPGAILGKVSRSNISGPINPKRLPNLQWFFDMTDESTVETNGGFLTRLIDKSSNNNDCVPVGTQRGVVGIDATTGKQTLTLNGTSNFLPLTNEVTLSSFTLVLVIKNNDLQTLSVLASGTSNTDYIATSGTGVTDRGAITLNNATDGSISWTKDESLFNYSVLIVRKKTSVTIDQLINGRYSYRAITTATATSQKFGQLFRQNSGSYMSGGFAGGCLFSDYKTDVEVLGIVKYFYGINNLSLVPRKNLFLGDSITNFAGNAFCNQVSASENRTEVMCGINGTTVQANGSTISFVERYANFFAEYPYDNYHTILGGANDINNSLSAVTYQTAYDTIVAGMIAQGTPAQNLRIGGGPYRLSDSLGSICQNFEDRAVTVATNRGTKKFRPYTKFKNGGGDTWMGDTLHANQSGHTNGYTPEILAAT